MKSLKDKILESIIEVAEMRGAEICSEINQDTVLLDSGLDSLGFAILVAKLEETLGYDPFVLMGEPVYPKTFGEFMDIYQRFEPK
jgi:acyl carrier protein